jgi:hypothetical protein
MNGYYGDPTNGGRCYLECQSRAVLPIIESQGIGSFKSLQFVTECLWMIKLNDSIANGSIIRFEVEEEMNVICQNNGIFIYNSISELIGQKRLLSVICKDENMNEKFTESRSGEMAIFYHKNNQSHGFNGIVTIFSCKLGTCKKPFICDKNDKCVCPASTKGFNCEIEMCQNCTNGFCDKTSGKCICDEGFGDSECSTQIKSNSIVIQELFNTLAVSNNQNHLKKTLPRFGHSINTDRRGFLWIFGGYSHANGALNDIRQFDTKNLTWVQVTVDGSDIKMPTGRYFHAAEITKQSIYVYGGISNDFKILSDFWIFNTHEQRWSEVEVNGNETPGSIAGHTMTIYGEKILLIGGYKNSSKNSLIWEFNLEKKTWNAIDASGYNPGVIFGHSASLHSSQLIYVFGGYQLSNETIKMTNQLYSLKNEANTWQWNLIPVFNELNRPEENLPRARFLHSTVAFQNYLLFYSGEI